MIIIVTFFTAFLITACSITLIITALSLKDKEYRLACSTLMLTVLIGIIAWLGILIVNDGERLTQTREVPIVYIERIDGTTYVYSKKGNAKDTSATIYICETNKLALIETYNIMEKSKREFGESTLAIKVK